MFQIFKSWLADDTVYIALLLIFVGVGSFGLGRFSVGETNKGSSDPIPVVRLIASSSAPTVLTPPATTALPAAVGAAVVPQVAPTGPYVASKVGSKYHLTTCPGAKRIKAENKIFFTSVLEAEAAGYTPANNCPGL